jgi:hypothetical protein
MCDVLSTIISQYGLDTALHDMDCMLKSLDGHEEILNISLIAGLKLMVTLFAIPFVLIAWVLLWVILAAVAMVLLAIPALVVHMVLRCAIGITHASLMTFSSPYPVWYEYGQHRIAAGKAMIETWRTTEWVPPSDDSAPAPPIVETE